MIGLIWNHFRGFKLQPFEVNFFIWKYVMRVESSSLDVLHPDQSNNAKGVRKPRPY
jgi:hypothetical protein